MSKLPNPQNRELSWLSFNERVLQEATDPSVPPIERLHFLGIVSSNLDEFYRVRIGSLNNALKNLPRKHQDRKKEIHALIDAVRMRTLEIQGKISHNLEQIHKLLADKYSVHLLTNEQLNQRQRKWAEDYFDEHVRAVLTIITNCTRKNLTRIIRTDCIYLVVQLSRSKHKLGRKVALVEIPSPPHPRFVRLPDALTGRKSHASFMWLDDIIRQGLPKIFEPFGFKGLDAYAIKLSRNAEMTVDDDIVANFIEQLSSRIKARDHGEFVRLNYDSTMPEKLFLNLLSRLALAKGANIIAGGRYHNTKSYASFPTLPELKGLVSKKPDEIIPQQLGDVQRYIRTIVHRDVLLFYPYHSFRHVVHLLREASVDVSVKTIKMTIYRVAPQSMVMNALANALQNGKSVVLFMELKARFDEEANINWARKMQEAGAVVLTSTKQYKVHSKLCLIVREDKPDLAVVSTGNFNERSAKSYSDISIMTAEPAITSEVARVFDFLHDPTRLVKFKHLLVAPRDMRDRIKELMQNEIAAARAGEKAYINLKINNLVDAQIVDLLDEAARAGVHVNIVVRSTCGLNPERPEYEGRMQIISIIDALLEHARIFIFHNQGDPLVFISSADLMKRNLDHRIEVAAPILNSKIKAMLIHIFDLSMADNCKSRIINAAQDNPYKKRRSREKKIQAQREIWQYLKKPGAGSSD